MWWIPVIVRGWEMPCQTFCSAFCLIGVRWSLCHIRFKCVTSPSLLGYKLAYEYQSVANSEMLIPDPKCFQTMGGWSTQLNAKIVTLEWSWDTTMLRKKQIVHKRFWTMLMRWEKKKSTERTGFCQGSSFPPCGIVCTLYNSFSHKWYPHERGLLCNCEHAPPKKKNS